MDNKELEQFYKDTSKNVRDSISEAGENIHSFSKKSGIDRSVIDKCCKDKKYDPRISTLWRIAKELNINITKFFK